MKSVPTGFHMNLSLLGDHRLFPSYETIFVPYHPGNVLGT